MPRVLVIAYPGCTQIEILPLLSLLEGHAEVVVVGPSTEAVRTSEGVRLATDETFTGASPDDVKLVVVPGGDPESVLHDPPLMALLRAVETPIAAICNGALLLAAAGLLRGKKVTHTAVEAYAPRPDFDVLLEVAETLFEGSTYVDEDVVIDGALITSKPWAALSFAKHAAVNSGLVLPDHAASRARYLRGFRDRSFGDPHQRWAIFLTQTERPTTHDDIEAHVAHLRALERRGVLELAGPFPEKRSGLVVVRARSRAEAEIIAAQDPFVTRGVRVAEVRQWLISSEDNNHLRPLAR